MKFETHLIHKISEYVNKKIFLNIYIKFIVKIVKINCQDYENG
jgi:hypothetical protein